MSQNRIKIASNIINSKYEKPIVLDLGCRDCILLNNLKSYQYYFGCDLSPSIPKNFKNTEIIKLNLENNFYNKYTKRYDVITALDIIEHLDNPYHFIKNIKKINFDRFILSTPNMFYWRYRLLFLFGKFTGKYDFLYEIKKDRHKWLVSNKDALNFINDAFPGYKIKKSYIFRDRGRSLFVMKYIYKFLAQINPNLFTIGIVFEIYK